MNGRLTVDQANAAARDQVRLELAAACLASNASMALTLRDLLHQALQCETDDASVLIAAAISHVENIGCRCDIALGRIGGQPQCHGEGEEWLMSPVERGHIACLARLKGNGPMPPARVQAYADTNGLPPRPLDAQHDGVEEKPQ